MFDKLSRTTTMPRRQRKRRAGVSTQAPVAQKGAPTPPPQPAVRIFKDGTAPFHLGRETVAGQ